MDHGVVGIHQEAGKVTAICTCGWETAPHDTETEARADFSAAHLKQKDGQHA